MKTSTSYKNKFTPGIGAMRYLAIAFIVLALALLVISAYSFLAARTVQENYNTMVEDTLRKLELIGNLHNNEDLIYDKVVQHLSTYDPDSLKKLEEEIENADAAVKADLDRLNELLKRKGRKQMLQNYRMSRRTYKVYLQELLNQSRQAQPNTIESQITLLPAYREHQKYLNRLSDSISAATRTRGYDSLKEIDNTVRNYNLLLLAALLVTAIATFLIRRVIQQLKQQHRILDYEINEGEQLRTALSKSKSIYRSLFQNIALPMWVFDANSLQILEVNRAALIEYGYSHEEFLLLSILDLQPDDQRAEVEELIRSLKSPFKSYINKQHKRKNGSAFYVDLKIHALPALNDMKPYIVVAINIDDQVRALQELERREKQFHEISSSIPGIVYQFQLDEAKQVIFPFVSEGVIRMFGYAPEEVKADSQILFQHVHPDDLKKLWNSILDSYENLTPWELEFRVWQQSSNKYIWLKGSSLPTRKDSGVVIWNGTLIDITNEKEAQEKLVTSEANLRYLLNSSPQSIYLLDKNLRIVAFNTRAEEEVRVSFLRTLRTGQSVFTYIDATQETRTRESHNRALQGETTVYETNTGTFWHEIAFRPVLGPEQQVLAVALSIEDITERKRIVESLQQSEKQLSRAQELSNMGSWEYDIIMGTILWSDNLYKLYDLSKETFTPQVATILQFVHPDDREMVQAQYKRARENHKTVTIEHRAVTPDGRIRNMVQIGEIFYDDHNQPVRMSGTIQDITARKEAEQEITKTKNLLQSTLANIPELIFSADADFNATYVSPHSYDILGYQPEELLGNKDIWHKNIYPDDLPEMQHVMERILQGENIQHEVRVIRRDKELRWLLLRMSPMIDRDGELIRIDGSAADITQQKLTEAKREELNAQLITQNRNLQQFAYIVSHNLRAPIANILGLASIYDRNNSENPINQRVIENMAKSARLLDGTIRDLNDLLAFRSHQQGEMLEKVSFETTMQQVTEALDDEIQRAEAAISSDFSAAPEVVTIKSYLHSIMHNLLSNALKYRDNNRKLNVIVKTLIVDDYICLQISDNGLGIDVAKVKDKLFGLYKRFHPNIAGRGLGLHLVKTQAELLGGKVDVESTPGAGTTFRVYFDRSKNLHERFKESNVD